MATTNNILRKSSIGARGDIPIWVVVWCEGDFGSAMRTGFAGS